MDGAKPIAFLPFSSLVRLPNYCLTNLCTSVVLISRFLVSSLFSFSFILEKKGFNNWIHYIDFVPPRLFPSLSL